MIVIVTIMIEISHFFSHLHFTVGLGRALTPPLEVAPVSLSNFQNHSYNLYSETGIVFVGMRHLNYLVSIKNMNIFQLVTGRLAGLQTLV